MCDVLRLATQRPVTSLLGGMLAGAAGTTALNATTYADMAIRGRPSSPVQSDSMDVLAEDAGVSIPGDPKSQENRKEGLGALSGIGVGVAVGALYGFGRFLVGSASTWRAW